MPKNTAYKTLTQAAHAARKLGIQTSTQYRQQCIEDPLLPYSPEKVYVSSWRGWPAFLGTKRERTSKVSTRFYPMYSQAKLAVRLLRIKSKSEYLKLYHHDPKLPADPQKIYSVYWKSWDSYLSNLKQPNRKLEIYKSLAQASRAAQALGPKTAREYIKIHHKDSGLPFNPATYYKNWVSWHHFLGTTPTEDRFYKTLRQASAATKALKIISARDYVRRYKLDSKLPSTPYQYYKNWVSWSNFLDSSTPP